MYEIRSLKMVDDDEAIAKLFSGRNYIDNKCIIIEDGRYFLVDRESVIRSIQISQDKVKSFSVFMLNTLILAVSVFVKNPTLIFLTAGLTLTTLSVKEIIRKHVR